MVFKFQFLSSPGGSGCWAESVLSGSVLISSNGINPLPIFSGASYDQINKNEHSLRTWKSES